MAEVGHRFAILDKRETSFGQIYLDEDYLSRPKDLSEPSETIDEDRNRRILLS
jgi:hypothetical protein